MGERLAAAAPDQAPVPRAVARRKTFEPIVLDLAGTKVRAHMLNLSTGGACLHSRCTLRAWQTVSIEVRGRVVRGRVSWIAGERCGVRFVQPLTASEVDAIAG